MGFKITNSLLKILIAQDIKPEFRNKNYESPAGNWTKANEIVERHI